MTKTKQREKTDDPLFPHELVVDSFIGKLSIHINTSEPDREFTRFARFIAGAVKAIEQGDLASLPRIARKSRNRSYREIMRLAIEGAARDPKQTECDLIKWVLHPLFSHSVEYTRAYFRWAVKIGLYNSADFFREEGLNENETSKEETSEEENPDLDRKVCIMSRLLTVPGEHPLWKTIDGALPADLK